MMWVPQGFRFAAVIACAAACAAAAGPARAQDPSDAQLLSMGTAAWNQTKCVTAARFFYAYLVRDPQGVPSAGPSRESLEDAISWCEKNTTVYGGSKGDGFGDTNTGPKKPVLNFGVVVQPPPGLDPTQRRCRAYASIAVAQNAVNLANRCGFTGNRWDSDYSNHLRWCTAVAPGACRAETQQRQAMLDQCAP